MLGKFGDVVTEDKFLGLQHHHRCHVWVRQEDLAQVVSRLRGDFLVGVAELVDENRQQKCFTFRASFQQLRCGDDRLDLAHFLAVLQRRLKVQQVTVEVVSQLVLVVPVSINLVFDRLLKAFAFQDFPVVAAILKRNQLPMMRQ